jgi:hypothetical protein
MRAIFNKMQLKGSKEQYYNEVRKRN